MYSRIRVKFSFVGYRNKIFLVAVPVSEVRADAVLFIILIVVVVYVKCAFCKKHFVSC